MKKIIVPLFCMALSAGALMAKSPDMLEQSRSVFKKNPHDIVPGHVLANVKKYSEEMESMMMRNQEEVMARMDQLEAKIDSMMVTKAGCPVNSSSKYCPMESSKNCCN